MLLGNRVAESLCRIRQPYHVYLSIDGGNEQAHDSNRGKDSFRRAVRGGGTAFSVIVAKARGRTSAFISSISGSTKLHTMRNF